MSAPGATVLFDAPGPRARRRTRLVSVAAGALLLALVVAALVRLSARGQLDAELWAPLVDPRTEEFPVVWGRLAEGLSFTLRAATAATVASAVIGVAIAAARLSLGRYSRLPLVGAVELLRGLPVVVTIFYVSVLLPEVGLDVGNFWFLVVGLTAYNCVIISEIVRAGVVALPRGQAEAGLAVGLTRGQTMRFVQLPQALRAMLPALISQLVVIIKDTALASIVLANVRDVIWHADRIRGSLDDPLQMYAVVAVLFVVICLALDRLAHAVDRRLGRARTSRASTAATRASEATTGA
ncbi:amino acid ABC transporter permease [Quadrisphaera sp. DSM 44207]|uniref:amino acid ABC transporter permease n=1 Tax=Quadrisphaera sp. DSM 44207 TaxID=1881057 RepID=UPI0008800942|nr:amino acid ABC transporter permease [Quadrisphaera sp. DSM 44207]SDQ33825.1 amino acid ABC transporter membrane protein 2, PAAT family [Quadrisphaera sp. DSM 44207]